MKGNMALLVLITVAYFLSFSNLIAQTQFEQIWISGELRDARNLAFTFKTKFEYESIVDAEERYGNFMIGEEAVYFIFPTLELIGALNVFHGNQNDTLKRTEIRPRIGLKVDIVRKGRIVIYNYFRFEWRNFFFNYSELNDSASRLRNKTGITFSLSKERPYLPKTFNLITSFEFYFTKDDQLKERFANKHRLEVGLAYRFSDNWRAQMTYYRQNSRNQLEDSFDTVENILQIKGIYLL